MALSFDEQQVLAAELADGMIESGLQRGGITEAKKVFDYFRATGSRELLFSMLRQRQQKNQPFYQTRNTSDHYARLLSTIEVFVGAHPSLSQEDLLVIFGWGIRLARYRNETGSGNLSLVSRQQSHLPSSSPAEPKDISTEQRPESVRPVERRPPAAGEIFAGRVAAVDESAVLVEVPGFDESKAIGVLSADAIEGGRTSRYRAGNSARVEVTAVRQLKSGRMVLELKPARR